jgi:enoyl-CoA hydratase/carnithine racemase
MAITTAVRFDYTDRVALVTLDRPGRKNALTFDAYAALRDFFRELAGRSDVRAVVMTGAGGDFCSGGDVREIVGPLTQRSPAELLAFAQMTGDVVKAMRACPQPIVAAVDGACAGAGAALAMASDLRYGTARARVAFLFGKVGLGGCDMGACAILPRIVGAGRAAELLFTGRPLDGVRALEWGFFNGLETPEELHGAAHAVARTLAEGPTLAHAATKKMLSREWSLDLDAAIDAEAHEQAQLMQSNDFRRAYEAFLEKRRPAFEGN